MAYKPIPSGPSRDKAYPSEISAERPIAVTRIHCYETPDPDDTMHSGESASERMNRELRER